MSCDIYAHAETRRNGTWTVNTDLLFRNLDGGHTRRPFDWRNYRMFGFLGWPSFNAPVLTDEEDPRGIPDDASPQVRDALDGLIHCSWLTLAELQAYDYDSTFLDAYGATPTVREWLGEGFFDQLDVLAKLGAPEDVRVVFGFNS